MIGWKVKARYGQFMSLTNNQKRREHEYIHGVVIMSRPDRKWRIYWTDIDQTSDHLRAGLIHVSPKDPALTEKAMEQLNEDTVHLHSIIELKSFVMGKVNAINVVNQRNENAIRLIAACHSWGVHTN